MRVRFNIKADFREAERLLKTLGPAAKRATARAINKTARAVKAESAREIQQKRNLRISRIKRQLGLSRARSTRLIATITASGRPISIREFRANQTRKGVTVKIGKSSPRIALRKYGNKSFRNLGFAKGSVFVRTGSKRLPIEKWPPVPGFPSVFVQRQVQAAMLKTARTTWTKRFREEIGFELRKAEARARAS